jgi:hypothetical protein
MVVSSFVFIYLLGTASASVLDGVPIWAASSDDFALLRGPIFTLRATPTSATFFYAASGSPRPPAGTTQAKLLGAACLYVNDVLASCGPGHNVPTASQVVRGVDVLPFLRAGGAPNVVGVASFFAHAFAKAGDRPAVQGVLAIADAEGSYNLSATGDGWLGWGADSFFNPTGNAGVFWYPMPNEDLNLGARPLAWADPGAAPSWADAAPAAPWAAPLYVEPGAGPVALARASPCRVMRPSEGRQILDFGQEMMGGVNLSFAPSAAGRRVVVTLAEVLLPDGSGVMSPMTTGNNFNSTWTLSGDAMRDSGVHHHEFIQFRYAQVDGSPADFSQGGASAWVMQHPTHGAHENPWENACSRSVPAAVMWGSGGGDGAPAALGAFRSSSAALDAVFNFSAYTIVATSLDVNVDGQTRERDVDIVDTLNTAMGQYYVFAEGDTSIQRRTLFEAFTNDTGCWAQWADFVRIPPPPPPPTSPVKCSLTPPPPPHRPPTPLLTTPICIGAEILRGSSSPCAWSLYGGYTSPCVAVVGRRLFNPRRGPQLQ